MRYKKGDRVVLRTDLKDGEFIHPVSWDHTFDYGGKEGVLITRVDANDKSYRLDTFIWIAEDMIDHKATAEFDKRPSPWFDFKELKKDNPWFDYEVYGPNQDDTDDSLSLTIHIQGAKEYRDKLEELHRQIETVEHTIEQLNEMDMTIEVEDN